MSDGPLREPAKNGDIQPGMLPVEPECLRQLLVECRQCRRISIMIAFRSGHVSGSSSHPPTVRAVLPVVESES